MPSAAAQPTSAAPSLRNALVSHFTDLSPAEEKFVQAVAEYVGVMKREGKDATRTFLQLRNRGKR
jgi:hypothetical protein